MDEGLYYKVAHESGWDFYTNETINYRDSIGQTVRAPKTDKNGRKSDSLFLYASSKPSLAGAWIPCSAYRVLGTPVVDEPLGEHDIYRFEELEVIEEIADLDVFFGWNYTEAADPINPFGIAKQGISDDIVFLAGQWVSVYGLVCNAVRNAPLDPIFSYIWQVVGEPTRGLVQSAVGSLGEAAWQSKVGDSVLALRDSVLALCYAYALSLFEGAEGRGSIDERMDNDIFRIVRNLWCKGIVPSHDTKLWRLHSGENAEIIWQEADNED